MPEGEPGVRRGCRFPGRGGGGRAFSTGTAAQGTVSCPSFGVQVAVTSASTAAGLRGHGHLSGGGGTGGACRAGRRRCPPSGRTRWRSGVSVGVAGRGGGVRATRVQRKVQRPDGWNTAHVPGCGDGQRRYRPGQGEDHLAGLGGRLGSGRPRPLGGGRRRPCATLRGERRGGARSRGGGRGEQSGGRVLGHGDGGGQRTGLDGRSDRARRRIDLVEGDGDLGGLLIRLPVALLRAGQETR